MVPILISVFVLIVSFALAWISGPVLGVSGTALVILRLLLVLLGITAATIILMLDLRKKKREGATKNIQGNTELDTLLRDAEKKLATAQRTGAKTLDSLPLLYLIGDSNSAKTTTVLKSGLDPELLAGQIYRNQDIVPTPVTNIWYTQQCVIVEAGDAIRKSPQLWGKLVRRTRPKAYRAALGSQAPVRAAVVCMSCEQFLGANATETIAASARATNQLLRDLAQQLGTEVPVYVILAKLDRVPGFTEYVRNLSSEEVSQVLGITTPRSTASSGLYVEQATQEVTNSLDQLIFSLGEFRLEILSRENDARNLDSIYEFPRELRKLRNNLASYLVELARPSHLNANPYLRGFYFTGVRAHIVEQMVSAPAQAPQAAPADAGATRMFSLQEMQAGPAQPTPKVVSQKIAQWAFLPRLFTGVILADRSALAATRNSGRTHTFRRVVFTCASVLLFLYLISLVISYGNNAKLEHEIASAAGNLPARNVPATMLASTSELASLDQLRAALVQLETYQQDGPPLMYRWGLYHGNDLLESARRIYFDRFQRLLLTNTQTNLVSTLGALPAAPQPGADYTAAYNPLRAYLITTSNPDKSTSEFLTPVLTQFWLNGRTAETDQQKQLAEQQFDFYANELRRGNPYSIAAAMPVVTHARIYLSGFGGFDRIYQAMLAAANKAAPPIDFNRLYPGSSAVVVEPHIVVGAFTRKGFGFMQDAIQHPDRYFSGEAWVLGDQAPPSLDRAALTQQLATRYSTDYQSEWRTYLRQAAVVKYRGLPDAGQKLQVLSNPSSPLLALVYVASNNTVVANADISKEFQPAQALVPPDSADKLMSQGNTAYINGLVALQGAVSQVAQDPTAASNPAAVQPITSAAVSAHGAVSQTSQAFNIDPQAHVEQTVISLMQAPINSVEEAVRGARPEQANGGGKSFCGGFSALMSKFPFSPNSTAEATPTEVAAVFQPGTGSLWQFYDATLKPLLIQQGSTYVPAPTAPIKLNPAFVHFFNQAAALSSTFYPAGSTSPALTFNAHILASKGIQSVTLAVDAQRLSGADISKQFTWSAQTAQMAQILANYGSNSLPLQFNGTWALFHLVDKGKLEQSGNPVRLAYPLEIANTPIVVEGTPLVVRIEFSGPNAGLLMPGGLSMRCVSEVGH
ncbi:MAG TPA: ImcF-related family protein [Pseudacidobacterium sp.]|nr:ImcF-related family protein [Pseudacidobacterium sp.]